MARTKTNPLEIRREVRYSEEEEEHFIEVANEIGISPAMRELGYPGSYSTAKKWFNARSLDMPSVSALKSHAKSMGIHYGKEEELASVELLMDRYAEKAMKEDLTPDELNKLSTGFERLIKTKRLIEGKSTGDEDGGITSVDEEIAKLTAEMEQTNDDYFRKASKSKQ